VEVGLAGTDLSISQYRVLSLLAEGMALPSSMAVRLDVRRPSITAVVDGLVGKGLVLRAHGEDDRRQVTHEITEAGLRALTAADEAVDARLSSILAQLEEGDEAGQAMGALALWGKALANWRRAKAKQVGAAAPAGRVPAGAGSEVPDSEVPAGAGSEVPGSEVPDSEVPAGTDSEVPDSEVPAGTDSEVPDTEVTDSEVSAGVVPTAPSPAQ
jgi:DNA-binding MarR family transcriptional regulator